MSVKHMAMVLDAGGLDGAEKLLLLSYCNRTDDDGYCYPGHARLADDCGTSIATVKRVKARLVAKKLIASKRRLHPVTGDPITNLTRVNLKLLAAMKRPDRDYDDNLMEALTFAEDEEGTPTPLPQKPKRRRKPAPAPPEKTAPDLLRAQDEPGPRTPSDLLKAQDEPSPGSTRAQPRVNTSPAPGRDEPLTVNQPSANRQAVPPSAGARPETGGAQTEGGTQPPLPDDTQTRARAAAPVVVVPKIEGVTFLQELGCTFPGLLVTGKTLADQGRRVQALLDAGWSRAVLRELLSRPLPPDVRSVGAVLSRRLDDAAAGPVPRRLSVPSQGTEGGQGRAAYGRGVEDAYTAAEGPALVDRRARIYRECTDCKGPVLIDGDLCARCAGYDRCEPCGVYVVPGGRCSRCGGDPAEVDAVTCVAHRETYVPLVASCRGCAADAERAAAAEVRRALRAVRQGATLADG